jgi:hypothetical protein
LFFQETSESGATYFLAAQAFWAAAIELVARRRATIEKRILAGFYEWETRKDDGA